MSTDFGKIISALDKHFKSLGIQYLIIGAKARDIVLERANIKLSPRRTTDVDIGILIDSWQTLERVRKNFESDKKITLNQNESNKVRYYYEGTPFDLVPFGGIETDGKISFPPFYDKMMTVLGYQEALVSSKTYKIDDAEVKVVTPEMLVALKIVAWDDNPTRQKDAQDIHFIMKNYEAIDKDVYECLLDNYGDILEKYDYDSDVAAIALMGFRMASTTCLKHVDIINEIFNDLDKKDKFLRNMLVPGSIDFELNEKICSRYLDALLFGLRYNRDKV